jgi:dTDP-4-amino-4,6-dideoxygalactose transaminase
MSTTTKSEQRIAHSAQRTAKNAQRKTHREVLRYTFGTVTITDEAKALVNQALDQGRLSCGRLVQEFEQRFADLVGAKEAVAVASGTDADALALAVLYDLGARRGDEVIVPALSFAATGNAVLQAGFKPVFVDIDPATLNIRADLIEAAITDRTRAIMPVHLMGKAAPMAAIRGIAAQRGLLVVGDAAEAHGCTVEGRDVATWADLSAFSLYVAHIISTGEGGIVVTDRPDFAEILRSLRSHGRFCKCKTCVVNRADLPCSKRFSQGRDMRFVFERIGFSCKMNEMEAAIGLGNLALYDEILSKRRANLRYLLDAFKRFEPYLYSISEADGKQIGPHAMPIIVGPEAPFTRDELMVHLSRSGIDPRDLFSSMPTQCPGFAFLGYRLGDFPNAEYVGDHGLHVGVHQDLTQEHLDYLISTVEAFVAKKASGSRPLVSLACSTASPRPSRGARSLGPIAQNLRLEAGNLVDT